MSPVCGSTSLTNLTKIKFGCVVFIITKIVTKNSIFFKLTSRV